MSIYTIPPTLPFADTLAATLLQHHDELHKIRIYLPNRRACKTLQESLLKMSGGKPVLLPIMQALGDVDEDELILTSSQLADNLIPPAIPPMRRNMILCRLIQKVYDSTLSFEQSLSMAKALAQLIDQIETEGLEIDALDNLVEDSNLAEYWQISLKVLKLFLKDVWPAYLQEEGLIDPGTRRRLLIEQLTAHYQNSPPSQPVIIAGSTGSIPAVRALMKTVTEMDNGSVILPGLDLLLEDDAWEKIKPGHPQATLKQTLETIGCTRLDVKIWGDDTTNDSREKLISEAMRPAESVGEWQNLKNKAEIHQETLNGVSLAQCPTLYDQAKVIALRMRAVLEEPEKTAILITPDRNLARTTKAILTRWDIECDDSAGIALPETRVGSFLLSILPAVSTNFSKSAYLSLLKHVLIQLETPHNFRDFVRYLDKHILRDPTIISAKDIQNKLTDHTDFLEIFNQVETALKPLRDLASSRLTPAQDLIRAHLDTAEKLSDTSYLWAQDDGEAASHFFVELLQSVDAIPPLSLNEYETLLRSLIGQVTVRPRYGQHPRLSILGQIEARMAQADVVILGGLNETVWPQDSGYSPWMSRPMMEKYGLPSLETSITLSAHDFAQGFCAPEVLITYSDRLGTSPAVPSRWLKRLDAVLDAANIDPTHIDHGHDWVELAKKIELLDIPSEPIERPQPTASSELRPKEISITDFETLMRDPYAYFAKRVLKLKELDELDIEMGAREKGTLFHDILEEFVAQHDGKIRPESYADLISIANDHFDKNAALHSVKPLWYPRFENIADWFIREEVNRNSDIKNRNVELKSQLDIVLENSHTVTLIGKADRIDQTTDNHSIIIDYKSGAAPSKNDVALGLRPQLTLEAVMIQQDAFKQCPQDVAQLLYWKLNGSATTQVDVQDIPLVDSKNGIDLTTEALSGFRHIMSLALNENTPYPSLPRGSKIAAGSSESYAYLARQAEWLMSADEDNGGDQ